MNLVELHQAIRQKPYVPIRLHLKNGDIVDIQFPELTMVTTNTVSIGWKDPDSKKRIAKDGRLIGTDYIDRFELVPIADVVR